MADAIADISHQLKTPLTSMMVMNDLLKTEEDPEKIQEFLSTQSHQLDKMQWLIQTLLKLSKLDAGTIEMKRESVQATELIDEAVTLPPKLREVTLLRWYQGLSPAEIVRVLRLPRSTVNYRLRKATTLLKGELEEWYHEE